MVRRRFGLNTSMALFRTKKNGMQAKKKVRFKVVERTGKAIFSVSQHKNLGNSEVGVVRCSHA